ncbi:MAG: hypothetical protein CMJ18_08570, partial [Phycisphaeraceae bacterium]|nr:hypothetical protein [Phycisphaeraceae bacterium]
MDVPQPRSGDRTVRTLSLIAFIAIATVAPAQPLIGLYTINPLAPTIGTNYTSLTDAVNDLVAQGVSGPVIFDLFDDAGPYTTGMPFLSNNVSWAPSTA